MSGAVARILRDAFRRYYQSHAVPAPPSVEKREFGVGDYGRKIVRRHISFVSEREFRRYLREHAPLYISYSIAYFEKPDAQPMEAKGIEGADMIFEFDADELGLFSPNDLWHCPNCGSRGVVGELRGFRAGVCPNCGGPAKVTMFPDPGREERLKEEVDTLVKDFLMGDLGISRTEISLNFSGNRGYHIHVRSPSLRELDKEARQEIVDYVTGRGIDVRYFFDVSRVPPRGPKPTDGGWKGRVARKLVEILSGAKDASELVRFGVSPALAGRIMRERGHVVELVKKGVWPFIDTKADDAFASVSALVRSISPYMGKEIDTNTSVDIHRLIRVPDTIHGGTGLLAKRIRDLWSFDPYRDAVALPERPYLNLHVECIPEFEFAGEVWGPLEDKNVELPLHVSVYLLSKGVASWRLTTRG